MHSSIARYLTLASVVALAAGCDTDKPLAPGEGTPDVRSAGTGNLAAPSNLTATPASYDRITLGWQDNTTSETSFEVRRSTTGPAGPFVLLVTLGANSIGHSDGGLEPSREYCYQVVAIVRKRVSAPSNTACATTAPLPFAKPVTTVNVVPPASTLADVSWADPSTNEAQFRVERAPDAAGPWTTVVLLGRGQTFLRDPVASEAQVCYRVIAVYWYGDATPSSSDCTTPPAGPTALTATATGFQTVDLAWTDNSAVEDGYVLLRYYEEPCYYYCYGSSWQVLAELPPNTTSYTDVSVFGGATYGYYVVARKDGGYSDASFQVWVYTTAPPAGAASLSMPATHAVGAPWTGPGPRKTASSPDPARKR